MRYLSIIIYLKKQKKELFVFVECRVQSSNTQIQFKRVNQFHVGSRTPQ